MSARHTSGRDHALVVSHNYWPTPGAGQLRMGMLTRALQQQGYTVTVVSLGQTAGRRQFRGPTGEQIVEVGFAAVPRIVNLGRLAGRALAHVLRRPSLVVTDPPPVVAAPILLVARSLCIPSAYYFSDSWEAVAEASPQRAIKGLASLFGFLDRVAFRAANTVIAVTESLAHRVEIVASGKVSVHPNGIDLSSYGADGPTWSPPLDFPNRYFVYAGNSGQVHGSHIFIDAAEQLQDDKGPFGLVYISYGSQMDAVHRSAANSATPILFLDRMPPNEVASIIRGSVAALSSIRAVAGYYDARPIKAIAGIACAVPLVYVGKGSFAETIMDKGLGFIADYSTRSTSDAMRAALSLTPTQRREIRNRCLEYSRTKLDQAAIASSIARRLPR